MKFEKKAMFFNRKHNFICDVKRWFIREQDKKTDLEWDKIADFLNETKPPIMYFKTNCHQN